MLARASNRLSSSCRRCLSSAAAAGGNGNGSKINWQPSSVYTSSATASARATKVKKPLASSAASPSEATVEPAVESVAAGIRRRNLLGSSTASAVTAPAASAQAVGDKLNAAAAVPSASSSTVVSQSATESHRQKRREARASGVLENPTPYAGLVASTATRATPVSAAKAASNGTAATSTAAKQSSSSGTSSSRTAIITGALIAAGVGVYIMSSQQAEDTTTASAAVTATATATPAYVKPSESVNAEKVQFVTLSAVSADQQHLSKQQPIVASGAASSSVSGSRISNSGNTAVVQPVGTQLAPAVKAVVHDSAKKRSNSGSSGSTVQQTTTTTAVEGSDSVSQQQQQSKQPLWLQRPRSNMPTRVQ